MASTEGSGTTPGEPDDNGFPRRKRKRVPVACGPCRGKKSKCDGKRPKCTGCEAQGLECVYATVALPSVATVPSSYLEQLERRLGSLEHEVRSLRHRARSPGTTASLNSNSNDRTPLSTAAVYGGPAVGSPAVGGGAHEAVQADTISPDATDGVGTIEFDDHHASNSESMFFGPSSNIAFIRLIQRSLAWALRDLRRRRLLADGDAGAAAADEAALQRRALGLSRPPSPHSRMAMPHRTVVTPGEDESHNVQTADSTTQAMATTAASVAPPTNDLWSTLMNTHAAFAVPPKEDRVRLARRFFSDTGVLFPYVSEATFWHMHAHAEARGFRSVRRSWLGLFNMILAMAISTDPEPSLDLAHRSALSYVHFCRARTLCIDQIMAGASVEIIQVMLLMTQYLQGSRRSMKTWTLHGIAVKAALQLGLHVTDAGSHPSLHLHPSPHHHLNHGPHLDVIEQESRLRTWQACIGLDRTLSMTFGRPPSIGPTYVRARLARHVFDAPPGQTAPPTRWSTEENSTHFWNATFNLYQIMYNVLDTLYGSNTGINVTLADLASSVMLIEQKLIAWQAALPPSLGLVSAADIAREESITLVKKLEVTLTLRYYNVRLLAHRPIVDCCLEQLNTASAAVAPTTDAAAAGTSTSPTPQQVPIALHEAAILRQVGQQSQQVCLQSAEAIISIVNGITMASNARRGFLGAWWFTLYYTFNASLVLVALLVCNADDKTGSSATERPRLLALIDDAITCIPRIDGSNNLADKCSELLATLRSYVQVLLAGSSPDNTTAGTALPWAMAGEPMRQPLLPHGPDGSNGPAMAGNEHLLSGQSMQGMPQQMPAGMATTGSLGSAFPMDFGGFVPDPDFDARMYSLFDMPGVDRSMPRDLLW